MAKVYSVRCSILYREIRGNAKPLLIGGVVISDNFLTTLGLVNNPSLIGTISALFDVGSFFHVVLTLFVGGLLGRKKTLLFGTSIMILGGMSSSISMIIAGRIPVMGLGNGLNCATAPVWQSETSTVEVRGKLVHLVMCVVGLSVCNWLDYGLAFVGESFSWRSRLAFQFIP